MVQKSFYEDQKSISKEIGGIAATNQKYLWCANVRCYITNIRLVSDTATSSSDGTNNFTFQVANLTASNNLLSSAITTNGNEIAADTAYSLTPNQNGLINAGDVLELQITKNATPTDLTNAEIIAVIDYLPQPNA